MDHTHLIVISNRLPISLTQDENNQWQVAPASGGLATALHAILRKHGGSWIGWPGTTTQEDLSSLLQQEAQAFGYGIIPVSLTEEDIQGYYSGFANEILWPLFHSFETRCHFVPAYWDSYCAVNENFAKTVAENSTEEDYLWVHDYHLMRVASYMRILGCQRRMGFFLHIPFPPPDIFLKLPWRAEILQGLLEYETLGFQTPNDVRNFLETLYRIQPPSLEIEGEGSIKRVTIGDSRVTVGAFPISIDFAAFVEKSGTEEIAQRSWFFHEEYAGKKIILGVDRADYTKGIPERIEAYYNALERYPEMREKVTLVQVMVPSRSEVPEYEKLKNEVDRLISQTNSQFGVPGWVPIHYFYRSLSQQELISYYRATDMMLVTSLRDGMNLVAKEYCACNHDEKGVLILSEFAGAAAELQDEALLVNPYDIIGCADAIYEAFTMPEWECKRRMQKLRAIIATNDIYHWVHHFLDVALSPHTSIPTTIVSDYVPTIDVENS